MSKNSEQKDDFAIVYRVWGENGNPVYTVDPEVLKIEAEGKDDVPLMEYAMLQKYFFQDRRVAFSIEEIESGGWNEIKDVDSL